MTQGLVGLMNQEDILKLIVRGEKKRKLGLEGYLEKEAGRTVPARKRVRVRPFNYIFACRGPNITQRTNVSSAILPQDFYGTPNIISYGSRQFMKCWL
jgi:hypothetical protein